MLPDVSCCQASQTASALLSQNELDATVIALAASASLIAVDVDVDATVAKCFERIASPPVDVDVYAYKRIAEVEKRPWSLVSY